MNKFKQIVLISILAILFLLLGYFCRGCKKQENKPTNRVIEYIDKEIKTTDTIIKTKTVVRNKEVEKLLPYQHIVYIPNYKLCQDTTQIDSLKTLTLMQRKTLKIDSSLFVLYNHKDSLQVKNDSLKDKYIDSLITQTQKKHWIKPFTKGLLIGIGVGSLIKR